MQKITIITINYNNKEGLQRTLDSVVHQTYKDFEYIIIDGGSTDGSKELIEQYSNHLNYWVSEPDKGIYNAMNKGILAANGEYLLFLNSGDELLNNNVLMQAKQHVTTFDLLVFDIETVYEGKKYIHNYPNKLTFQNFIKGSIGHPTTFISIKLFKKIGLYDENYKIVSDWKFFLEALAQHKATYKKINIILSTFYMDGISTTNESGRIQEIEEILKKEYPFYYDDYISLNSNMEKLNEYNFQFEMLKKNRIIKLLKFLGFFKFLKF